MNTTGTRCLTCGLPEDATCVCGCGQFLHRDVKVDRGHKFVPTPSYVPIFPLPLRYLDSQEGR